MKTEFIKFFFQKSQFWPKKKWRSHSYSIITLLDTHFHELETEWRTQLYSSTEKTPFEVTSLLSSISDQKLNRDSKTVTASTQSLALFPFISLFNFPLWWQVIDLNPRRNFQFAICSDKNVGKKQNKTLVLLWFVLLCVYKYGLID